MSNTDELRAAARQALVALVHHTEQTRPIQRTADAIAALRAALAQQTAAPMATVTECEACFTPDACQLRGKCDHYAAEQLRVQKPAASGQPVAWHMRVIGCDGSADWCELGADRPAEGPGIEALPLVYAQQPAASGEPAEPLKGWKLNHVQKGPDEGMAEIGYLDPEDGHFSPIVKVDTDLYYQPGQALPLAVAILGALADAAPQPAPALSQAEQWNRAGRDPFKFHPQASHVSPDYRDGWNAALDAVARSAQPAPAPRLKWMEAPRRSEWGAGMMEALVALGPDETLRLYADRDAVPMADAVLAVRPAPARVPLTDERLNSAGLDYALADSFSSGKAEWVAQDIADAFKAGARAAERYYAAAPTAPPVNQSLTTAAQPSESNPQR